MRDILVVLRLTKDELEHDTKYIGILNSLGRMQYHVQYTFFDNHNIMLCDGDKKKIIYQVNRKINLNKGYIKSHYLCKAINQLFTNGFSVDYCYIRDIIAFYTFVQMCKSIKSYSASKIIIEIPTYPADDELLSDPSFIRRMGYRVSKLFKERAAKYVDLFAVIGQKCNVYMGRPAINIENGIESTSITVKKSKIHKTELHMLGLGKMARWHGFDRVIKGLYEYYQHGGQEKIYFHLVGNDGDGSLKKWKKLTNELVLNDYIIFEGPKYGVLLDSVFEQCDIGCDSLAGYVKNMQLSSSLKVREYCARGLPFVYTANDRNIDVDLPYWYRVSDTDEPIDIEKIIEFWNILKPLNDIAHIMHEYAIINMDWATQLNIIFKSVEGEQ